MALTTEEIQANVQKALVDVIGKTTMQAQDICTDLGLSYRILYVNGHAAIVTRDVRYDRIGLTLDKGKVIYAQVG